MSTTSQTLDSVIRKLEELRQRYKEIGEMMNRPEIASDPNRIADLSKEHGTLKQTVDPYMEYLETQQRLEESEAILNDPEADQEFKELAEEEASECRDKAEKLMQDIQKALVTSDDAAISSIILEIRAGTGGQEAALFVRDLYEMYNRYCERHNLKLEVMDSSPSDLGGFKEIVLNVKGTAVYRHLGYEGGGHRVQRVPDTESQGRLHTSAATVAVMPEAEQVDVQIDWEKDVVEHVSRAGGPGGQNVNKVSSAIKLEHLPTGITVSMRDEKSQHKNRAKAQRILMSRIHDMHMQKQQAERDASRKTMIGSGDRSQRIRTYNFPQNRVSDHRINLDLYKLDQIMQGELDELIAALQEHDMAQRLQNL
jgi:peptide chain release factor 1